MKEVIERCNWLVNNCEDMTITPDVKDDVRYLLEEIERLKEMKLHTEKYASEMEDKYIIANNIINKVLFILEHMEDDRVGYEVCIDILKGDDKN